MNVLTARATSRAARVTDINGTVEGELVSLGFVCAPPQAGRGLRRAELALLNNHGSGARAATDPQRHGAGARCDNEWQLVEKAWWARVFMVFHKRETRIVCHPRPR